jgi:hypothetical protein
MIAVRLFVCSFGKGKRDAGVAKAGGGEMERRLTRKGGGSALLSTKRVEKDDLVNGTRERPGTRRRARDGRGIKAWRRAEGSDPG